MHMCRKIVPVFVLVSLILLSCGGGNKAKNKKEIIKPVKYEKVFLSGGIQTKTFNGISKSSTETKLSFRTNGLVTNVYVKVGDKIKKNQLMAKLDQNDIILNYDKYV